jgi:TetR/AcrR family transcriptional regulator, transcriptional repressor for nem operon
MRARIIDAAATLMYERGVTATSLDEVLLAAGSGKSQLYHYFVDKADLTNAVIERQLQLVLAEQPALERINSWESLDAWVAEVLRKVSAPGGPFACPLGTMAAELKNDESFRPSLASAFRRWAEPLARGLQSMQDAGELVLDADPTRLATGVIAAMQGGMLLSRVHEDVTPMQDALEGAVAQLHRWRPDEASTPKPRKRRTGTSTRR